MSVHSHSMHSTQDFAKPHINAVAMGIAPGQIVVDMGSGSGAYVLAAAAIMKGEGEVYALDIQQDLLRRIKNEAHARGYSQVHTVWCDIERPKSSKLADGIVDRVIVSNVLFQVADKHAVLREARRIMKPSGRLVLIDWSESFGGLGPHKREVVKKDVALGLANAAGFEMESEFSAGAHHYGCILKPTHVQHL